VLEQAIPTIGLGLRGKISNGGKGNRNLISIVV